MIRHTIAELADRTDRLARLTGTKLTMRPAHQGPGWTLWQEFSNGNAESLFERKTANAAYDWLGAAIAGARLALDAAGLPPASEAYPTARKAIGTLIR